MKNTEATTNQCDGQTKKAQCSRNASVTIPASAFTSELHFCKTHERLYIKDWTTTMAVWTR